MSPQNGYHLGRKAALSNLGLEKTAFVGALVGGAVRAAPWLARAGTAAANWAGRAMPGVTNAFKAGGGGVMSGIGNVAKNAPNLAINAAKSNFKNAPVTTTLFVGMGAANPAHKFNADGTQRSAAATLGRRALSAGVTAINPMAGMFV